MRVYKFIIAAGLLIAGLGCSGPSVRYDYEAQADFAQFHTYAWQAAPSPGRARGFDNAIMEGRIRRTVEAELAGKGFQRDDGGHPDFLVDCYPLRQSARSSQTHLGLGLGMGFGPMGVGVSAPVGDRKVEAIGALVLEIQDARTRALVWKATADSALNSTDSPGEADDAVKAAVHNMLKKFPPPRP